jgi:hypothetical protein
MKTKEEIERLARIYENYNPNDSEIAQAESGGCYHGYKKGYTQCQEDIKPLLKDLFSLWESLAEVGEISIGQNFTKKYEELKSKLNKQD